MVGGAKFNVSGKLKRVGPNSRSSISSRPAGVVVGELSSDCSFSCTM